MLEWSPWLSLAFYAALVTIAHVVVCTQQRRSSTQRALPRAWLDAIRNCSSPAPRQFSKSKREWRSRVRDRLSR